MRRVLVMGTSGSGKTTTARRLAAKLDVPHVELDAIYHQPGWTELPRDEFRVRVTAATEADGWVIDGNYSDVRDLVLAGADAVVWLDLPRWLVMRRVITRTLHRAITRQVLWNGNREPLTNLYRWAPEKNIIRWAWTRHPTYAKKYGDVMQDPANAHVRFIRLRSQREIDSFLEP